MVRMQIRLGSWILASGILLAGVTSTWAQVESHAVVVRATKRAFSPPLSQIAPLPPAAGGQSSDPDAGGMRLRRAVAPRTVQDAALSASPEAASLATQAALSTNAGVNILGLGVGFTGYSTQAIIPDTNGAVGSTQFVQFVNESFAVFDKSTGNPIPGFGPINGNTLWQFLGAPCSTNSQQLDEIAQYDKLANRWVMLMPLFITPPYLCIAVSATSDATGSWNLYAFQIPPNSTLCGGCKPTPDYPKLAVWPDGYYIAYDQAVSQAGTLTYEGPAVCAVERSAMLNGTAANMQCFTNNGAANGLWLAGDLDGTTPPPSGSPEYLLNLNPNDTSLDLWQMHVDWTTPNNSTLTGPTSISLPAAFTEPCGDTAPLFTPVDNCVPQAGTTQMLNAYGDRLMYRLAYRNFGAYEDLVANHTVQLGTGSTLQTGINWYELRNTGSGSAFGIYQQGTYAPDSSYRWMGSIAMDGAGDIALGYSVSSSAVSPSIAYTGRVPSDQLGQMESEIDILSGITHASQNNSATFHWADYSSMAIDPTDDCTFWYTTEYVPAANSNWSTRIASFSFPTCTNPTLTVTVAGAGGGTVTSTPAGINCPTQCSSSFPSKTSITLSAAAASGSSFGGWNGSCSGTAACIFTITSGQTVSATFNAQADFTVTPTPPSATVSAGGVASFNLAIAGVAGFSSPVALSCTAPTTQGVNCSLASPSAPPGSSVSLTVTTTGPSAALISSPRTIKSHPIYAAWIGFPALGLMGIGSLRLRWRKRRLTCMLFCAALLGSVALQMACGGSSGGAKNSGTPPGTYTVNINATSGNTQHSSSVSITVQ